MNKRTLGLLLLISVAINLSALGTFSYYKWFHNSHGRSRNRRAEYRKQMYEKLKLNPAQRAQMDTLHARFIRDNKPIWEKSRKLRGEILSSAEKDSVDMALVEQKVDSLIALEKMIEIASVKNLMRYKKILNDEQQKEFMKMIYRRYHIPKVEEKSVKKTN